MLLRYFLNEFEVVPVAPIITVITFDFTVHVLLLLLLFIIIIIIIIIHYLIYARYLHPYSWNKPCL